MTLQRSHSKSDVTLGMLTVEGVEHSPIYTLENPWKDNKPWVSSIPAGDYAVARKLSRKFGNCFEVYAVDGRTDILIHAGNTERDTSGCILVGMKAGKLFHQKEEKHLPAVLASRDAMTYLHELLKNNDNFTLTIKD